ncbi:hypothetical protein [Bacillus safensis]|nr:hypothetical protein [Bacillus safensis]
MKNDVNILNVKKHDALPEVEKITYQVPSLDAKKVNGKQSHLIKLFMILS